MSTREVAENFRNQVRSFRVSINDVDKKTWSLRRPIPCELRGIIGEMGVYIDYCERRREAARSFYNRYRKRFAVKLFMWITMSIGINQMSVFQAQLEYYENWLNVADLTLSLWMRQYRPEELTRLDACQEERDRRQLRQNLIRVQRRQFQYQELKRFGINLNGLRQLALDILDDLGRPSTCSPASTTESPPYHQHPAYRRQASPPAHKSRADAHKRQPRPSQKSSGYTAFRYVSSERRYRDSRRETTFRHATPNDSMRETRPSPSYRNRDEQGRYHIPKQKK